MIQIKATITACSMIKDDPKNYVYVAVTDSDNSGTPGGQGIQIVAPVDTFDVGQAITLTVQ
jgi:hypothetical protein